MARRFAVIMAGLAALVARRFLRMPHLARFTLLLWGCLNRAVQRFHRILTQPAKRPATRVRVDRAADPEVRRLRLPFGRGWLVRELGWEAAGYMAQLEALLAGAEIRAALANCPGAGRVLRPICRMLGVAALTPKVTSKPSAAARIIAAPGTRMEATAIPPLRDIHFSDA